MRLHWGHWDGESRWNILKKTGQQDLDGGFKHFILGWNAKLYHSVGELLKDPVINQLLSSWWQLKYFLFSSRSLGRWSKLTNIFQMGWNHQLEDVLMFPGWQEAYYEGIDCILWDMMGHVPKPGACFVWSWAGHITHVRKTLSCARFCCKILGCERCWVGCWTLILCVDMCTSFMLKVPSRLRSATMAAYRSFLLKESINLQFLECGHPNAWGTVDGRNPKQPPGMFLKLCK